MFPDVGSSSFSINFISVDFPLPDVPTKKANSPLSITKFAFFTAFVPVSSQNSFLYSHLQNRILMCY